MIPRTIHYCWFGRNPKPALAERCIQSWKKYCPDYTIVEWNEDNFDIPSAPLYVRQAYEAKKWAFVTDYVRLKVVFDQGGIYLDTDVELVKTLDEKFLDNEAFFCFDDGFFVNTGIGFGAVKGQLIVKKIMEQYHDIPFLKSDGTYDQYPCPMRNTDVLVKEGLRQDNSEQLLECGVRIFSSEYFAPIDYKTGKIHKTEKTVSIHWYDGSWQDESSKQAHKRMQRWQRVFGKKLGDKLFGITECMRNEGLLKYIKKRFLKR